MADIDALLTVGELARRGRVRLALLRVPQATLRRVAFNRAAQQLGIGLAEVADTLEQLPQQRTPNRPIGRG